MCRYFAIVLGFLLLTSCGGLEKAREILVDAQSGYLSDYFNEELKYTGVNVEWKAGDLEEDSRNFKRDFEKELISELDRRLPNIFKGNQPVRIEIKVSDVYIPGAIAKHLAGKDPSMEIEAIVKDESDQIIAVYETKIAPAPMPANQGTGGINFTFQIGKTSDILAVETAGWLSSSLRIGFTDCRPSISRPC